VHAIIQTGGNNTRFSGDTLRVEKSPANKGTDRALQRPLLRRGRAGPGRFPYLSNVKVMGKFWISAGEKIIVFKMKSGRDSQAPGASPVLHHRADQGDQRSIN